MWTKEVTIWCDGEDCVRWIRPGNRKVSEARRAARDDGWTHSGGGDYCPECRGDGGG